MQLNKLGESKRYNDEEIIKMFFENERTETVAIHYLLQQNRSYVLKFIFKEGGTQRELDTVLNDGLIILINNIRTLKFKRESSLSTYFIGICKLLWKRMKTKNALYTSRNLLTENVPEEETLSVLIDKFEQQNENNVTLKSIYALLTDKCRAVLELWALGLSMDEIKDKMGYKNAQIAMNKKNRCLKGIIEKVKSWNV